MFLLLSLSFFQICFFSYLSASRTRCHKANIRRSTERNKYLGGTERPDDPVPEEIREAADALSARRKRPPLAGVPAEPDADTNFAQPWTYTDEQQLFGVVRGEYDLSDNISVWLGAGARKGEEANVLANPSAARDGSLTAYRFDNTREDDVISFDTGLSAVAGGA